MDQRLPIPSEFEDYGSLFPGLGKVCSVLKKLPIKTSAGLGLSLIDRAVKEHFSARCRSADLQRVREYFTALGPLRCMYCGIDSPSRWDHLHPVSRGGETVPGNLVPACQRCDDSKQDRDLRTWARSRSQYRPRPERLADIEASIAAYQKAFSHYPSEFEERLSVEQREKYKRFRSAIDFLRDHLKEEGFLK